VFASLVWNDAISLVSSTGDRAAASPASGQSTFASDEALMARYQSGDAKAFDLLYRRHRTALYRFIKQMMASRSDTEEVFQDVWIAVIKSRTRYRPTARFITYLFAIARRRVADRMRGRLRWKTEWLEDHPNIEAPDEPGPLAMVINAQLGRALLAALADLPPLQREVFVLHAETDLTLVELAAVTQSPEETVKSRLRYANAKLRWALRGWRA